jgi:hypothetical protein
MAERRRKGNKRIEWRIVVSISFIPFGYKHTTGVLYFLTNPNPWEHEKSIME